MNTILDLAIIGGGPAGLQAALTAGRVHRDVVLLDAGEGRNAPATHMHNVITRDGTPPQAFRDLALAELQAYPTVSVRPARVSAVVDEGGEDGPTRFRIELEDGDVVISRAVVLATGVRDELPAIEGIDGLWGDLVAQCPFCHGHEFADARVAIVAGEMAVHHLSALLAPIVGELVTVDPARVGSVQRYGRGARLHLVDGGTEDVAGIFVQTVMHQGAPFAGQLGLDLNDSGAIRIDERGRASRRGVYAAGDAAHLAALPMAMASVVNSMAAGMMAGASGVADLAMGALD